MTGPPRSWTRRPKPVSCGRVDGDSRAGHRGALVRLDAVAGVAPRDAQDPLTLRFLDDELEGSYQRAAGAEGLAGLRVIAGASALLWTVAAVLLPRETVLPAHVAVWPSLLMASTSTVVLLASGAAPTLDRQHAMVSVLTAANGLVILTLASAAGLLPGYGVSAVMLLFTYGFVSRTRFVFAAFRTAVVAFGFVVAGLNYRGPESLVLDAFIFSAAVVGSLLALRLLEQGRRRVFFQELVIRAQSAELELEKDKSDRLLLNVLPASVSARLREGEQSIADEYPSVSVLFADLVGFTGLAARLTPAEVIEMLSRLFTDFDALVAERGLEKIKTIGDAYMAAGGLPDPLDDHAARVVDLGLAMLDVTLRHARPGVDLGLRVGIHSGPVVGGVIGTHKFTFDIWGDTVNVASRLEAHGARDRVQVSATTRELAGDGFAYQALGSLSLRGHAPIEAYAVIGKRHLAAAPGP
jgi:class 3 adenylate cyclase